jgi:MYXO-CTERM domain-containing protein
MGVDTYTDPVSVSGRMVIADHSWPAARAARIHHHGQLAFKVGTIMSKLAVALCMVLMAASPALASFWTGTPVSVPEIDGPAGASALALLVAVGLIAYQRRRH